MCPTAYLGRPSLCIVAYYHHIAVLLVRRVLFRVHAECNGILGPRDIWIPGPKFFEIFGPPLKYFIPHGFMNSNEWTGLWT